MTHSVTEKRVRTEIPALGGTYILLMRVQKSSTVEIGKKGTMKLQPGFYLYVGSAFGSGGLRARVGRHARDEKSLRWHIDYLRQKARLVAVYFSTDEGHLEDDWAESIQAWPWVRVPMPGFGASDSQVLSHLFFCPKQPDETLYHGLAGRKGVLLSS